jgi:hypothetical protein
MSSQRRHLEDQEVQIEIYLRQLGCLCVSEISLPHSFSLSFFIRLYSPFVWALASLSNS